MARRCGTCHSVLRWDDQTETVQNNHCDSPPAVQDFMVSMWGVSATTGTVTSSACGQCAAKLQGLPPPAPKLWPVGVRVPFKPGNPAAPWENIDICGVCRRANYEDDAGDRMRLTANDLALPNELRRAQGKSPIRPGAYMACRDCIAQFKPTIRERLLRELPWDGNGRERIKPELIPALAEFSDDWLM